MESIFQQDNTGSQVGDQTTAVGTPEGFNDGASEAESTEVNPVVPEQPAQEGAATGETKGDKGEEAPAAPDEVTSLRQTNSEMRAMMREQAKQLTVMRAQIDRLGKVKPPEPETDDYFSDGTKPKPPVPEPELSKFEQYQQALNTIVQERAPMFDVMLDVLENKPQFADVREVCSQSRLDDLTEAMARTISQKEGRDQMEVQAEIEYNIWAKPNPYKFIYSIIKEHHPDYTVNKPAAPAAAAPVTSKRSLSPATPPTSIQDVGGNTKESVAGWTAKRIDEMPEEKLHTVPGDVYEKYMLGQLG